ncbi:nuclease-related domain-containing protein [Brevibacillus choshinensis]|uniref:nuclease-related domain-containing protein n=1 Tax=Brevibacillus choshinensis TaxID=54911 RepID=UPI002E1F41DA|nr:topoisomerase DNA-binding C4 zinc finger domain-containing protein [Brevibacillus choshinensis]MED4785237.1 topoisomerase DNA-binding C4 zinc finger domain-containing protein [Brevibacillus choshinensis]
MYNPIWQNKGHVKALAGLLGENSNVPIIPIVAFSSRAKLKIKVKPEVVYIVNLLKTIRKFDKQFLSHDDISRINGMLAMANKLDRLTRETHVKAIKEGTRATNINRGAGDNCPRCGGKLVQRRGKFGPFLGCSGFPACRFIT